MLNYKEFLDFKIRNNYLDLPNDNYTPAVFANTLEVLNKLYLLLSVFSLYWFVLLFSIANFPPFYTVILIVLMGMVFLSMMWLAMIKKIDGRSFIVIFGFLILTSFVWLIKVSA